MIKIIHNIIQLSVMFNKNDEFICDQDFNNTFKIDDLVYSNGIGCKNVLINGKKELAILKLEAIESVLLV